MVDLFFFLMPRHPPRSTRMDTLLPYTPRFRSEIAAAPIAPLTVQLPYRRPDDVREYERFFRAPLEFGALATAFLLRNDDLARPVVLSDEALAGYLDGLAEQILAALGAERTLRDRVRRVLWSELSEGGPAR